MGRSEKRKREGYRKQKITMTVGDLEDFQKRVSLERDIYDTEALLTCFALVNRELWGHGRKRILRALNRILKLMEPILNDEMTIEDYKKQLLDETGILMKNGVLESEQHR